MMNDKELKKRICVFLTVLYFLIFGGTAGTLSADVDLQHRWIYVQNNLLVEKNIPPLLALMERAKKSGYNGMMLSDTKFGILGQIDERYFKNARQVIAKAQALNFEIVPCIFPLGYAESILAHDVNLVEGLPVIDAPFEVRDGKIVPFMDNGTKLLNGNFEEIRNGKLVGWRQEEKALYIDSQTVKKGKNSVRMEDIGNANSPSGNCRIYQLIKTKPFQYYHLSIWIKTEKFENPDCIRLQVLAKKPKVLAYENLGVKSTQDWTQHHIVFNSLDNDEVSVYFGTWGGRSGKLWCDDFQMEPAGFVNVIRRSACPVKVTSFDKNIVYKEDEDFSPVVDPKLGHESWPGTYAAWHALPEVKILPGSRLKEGDRVLVSYYHPMIIYDSQLTCSLVDPNLYAILDDQMKRVNELFQAKSYMMSHDEIRVGGWTPDYEGMSMGQALAANVKKCCAIVKKYAPDATIYVWSDMFDPNHNARDDYYLVKTGWAGSWEGLPSDVVVVDWYSAVAPDSFKFFHERGHKQFIAGYYDGDPDANAKKWLESAKTSPAQIIGIMYTTWRSNYEDIERFSEAVLKYQK
jgi:hypothetical protein